MQPIHPFATTLHTADLTTDGIRRDPVMFRCPPDLGVTATRWRAVLIVGSCLMDTWPTVLADMAPDAQCDHYLIDGALPEAPARPIGAYEFQLVQLPLRGVLADSAFARLLQDDLDGHKRVFSIAVRSMRRMLADAMRWNIAHQIVTFVLPFVVPQQNAVGRLMDRYDLRNPVYFVEKLNEVLARELAQFTQAYFFDLNELIATHGRRFIQEDMITQFNQGGVFADHDARSDIDRLDGARRAPDCYERAVNPIIAAAWHELAAMVRTLRGTDAVRLVVIDLDDTLWRGSVAELEPDEMPTSEGWRVGLWEALLVVKRRGILLGIVSQNDEARVRESWDHILLGQVRLEDFAVRRIDWRPKADQMAEVLGEVNLPSTNVVFIADNPLQRAQIEAVYPGIRVLGGDPFTWRHILLWAAETQTAAITTESRQRTEMDRAQVVREEQCAAQSRPEFLAGLALRMTMFRLDSAAHPEFARVLEFVNKTNQFNTTGERWTAAECASVMAAGTRLYAFDLADVFTAYGLVGVLVVDGSCIRQFVMSCRVLGLEVEHAAIGHLVAVFHALGRPVISARLLETKRNLPIREIYGQCGFVGDGPLWQRSTAAPPPIPAHITLTAPPPMP